MNINKRLGQYCFWFSYVWTSRNGSSGLLVAITDGRGDRSAILQFGVFFIFYFSKRQKKEKKRKD